MWEEDQILSVNCLLDQIVAGQRALQSIGHDLVLHQQQLGRLFLEQFHRQGAVAFARRLDQHMAQPGTSAEQRIDRNADLLRDLISGF